MTSSSKMETATMSSNISPSTEPRYIS
jgi:hypothetical protein